MIASNLRIKWQVTYFQFCLRELTTAWKFRHETASCNILSHWHWSRSPLDFYASQEIPLKKKKRGYLHPLGYLFHETSPTEAWKQEITYWSQHHPEQLVSQAQKLTIILRAVLCQKWQQWSSYSFKGRLTGNSLNFVRSQKELRE